MKTEFTYPEGHFFLPVLKSIAYVKPLLMPPNIRDRTLRPILIDDSKVYIFSSHLYLRVLFVIDLKVLLLLSLKQTCRHGN